MHKLGDLVSQIVPTDSLENPLHDPVLLQNKSTHLQKVVDDVLQLLVVGCTEVDVVEASRATGDGGSLLSEESREVHALGGDVLDAHG